MAYKSICISAGHGKYVRGASGSPIPPMVDEVDEARKITSRLGDELKARGVDVKIWWDDVSKSQSENLDRIVDWHNSQPPHDLDCSIHLNAYDGNGHGTECLYLTQPELAGKIAAATAACGYTNRGPKKRTDLAFLNGTSAPAILQETFFCDNRGDCDTYNAPGGLEAICTAMADVLGGPLHGTAPPPTETAPPPVTTVGVLFKATGKCSYFGGPQDTTGMTSTEGLAMIQNVQEAPWLFPEGTPGTENMGLARKLNSYAVSYCACRWNYDVTPKPSLLENVALVTAEKTGKSMLAYPADWGPNETTNRVADLSPWLMRNLGIETDDVVTVEYPAPNQEGTS